MAAFSIEKALTSGFGLLRREWKTALAWGAIYVAVIVAIEFGMMGAALGSLLTSARSDPEAAAKSMEHMLAAGAWGPIAIGYLLMLSAIIVLYGAITRAHLRPDERGRLFIRFSRQELWMGLSVVALYLVVVPAMGIAAIVLIGLVGALSDGDTGKAVLMGLLLGIPAGLGGLYVLMRLSLSWLIAWDESRFVLFESWRLTKGHGWRMVLLYLALIFLMMILVIGLVLVFLVTGAAFTLTARAMGPAGLAVSLVGIVLVAACYVPIVSGFLVIAISPWITAYRGLRDARTAERAAA